MGGVEVCAGFSSEKDRELVVAAAERVGLEPPKLESPGEGPVMWELELRVALLVVESKRVVSASSKDNMYCFLRYRFFDLGEDSAAIRFCTRFMCCTCRSHLVHSQSSRGLHWS